MVSTGVVAGMLITAGHVLLSPREMIVGTKFTLGFGKLAAFAGPTRVRATCRWTRAVYVPLAVRR